ncbi:MAG: CHAD domain-containing protein [Pirellulales bacterium]|nr:CHAD domain-containing protein [Pirellulales bacterium]
MAKNSKWIEANCKDEPVSHVACRVIRSRLKAVCGWLIQAAEDDLRGGESVHQLRVATRRAMVAIDLFERLLPRRRSNWLRKRLKQIRKTAGPARDLDVMAKRLSTDVDQRSAGDDMVDGLTAMLEQIAEARCDAQADIIEVRRKLKKTGFSRRARKLADKAHWRVDESLEPTFHSAAAATMRTIVTEFFDAAESDLDCTQALHEIRIAAKHLRYAMEVFAGVFSSAFRGELYPLIEQLQEQLGTVNDHATAQRQYSQWLTNHDCQPQRSILQKLIAQEAAALQQSTAAFRQWWTSQRAADLKARLLSEISPTEARCA